MLKWLNKKTSVEPGAVLQVVSSEGTKVSVGTSQEEFDAQAVTFLETNGFPLTEEYKGLFAMFIQHSADDDDTFDPDRIARCIRKAKAKEYAYYLIHPEKRAKPEPQLEVVPDAKEEN